MHHVRKMDYFDCFKVDEEENSPNTMTLYPPVLRRLGFWNRRVFDDCINILLFDK